MFREERAPWDYGDPVMWPYYLLGGVVVFIISCLLANTVSALFDRISPDLRTMNPTQIWISVIPIFGSAWIFYIIYQLANALRDEFGRRKIVEFETSPGLGAGWAFAFLAATAHLTLLIDETLITVLLYVAATILLIVYWAKIAAFKNKLYSDDLRAPHNMQTSFPHHQPASPPQNVQWPPYHPPYVPPIPPSPEPPKQEEEWERWRPK